ncbi:50S ribosomal protein L1 [Parascardovia denticolens IPLA 20019]|uniref:Large ribosomal subunit protein uL1 n=1 Tax=Parascardovia denticolens DSM 10105 = JCM 12538 TaxID=864564 RepID=E6K2Y6_PARDN|nr:50S ribosomal protein L1 [Parascardovia denticolens]EFG32324.1 50S ribosomal protein L1 [Parascardovia denticolens F0305]EFT82690.1 ribosomal protein L1 [Parascardovia denticolens DSM 10105 = JCM 12538]EIT88969.1 50S ribosomal protein L1 [Parascardovia denticolens IPLA 20019]BAR04818.1 50S ribosomal protein L1 [Parascardovia denticolens DSM 10105 = JCM 12538]
MTKRSKKYREAAEMVDRNNLYTDEQAVALLKSMPKRGFDETVEATYVLNVDPRKADQLIRGTVNLPHGTGKTARVLVFARGPQATAAVEAGADEVGDDELIEKVSKGYLDFDAVVATPDMMGKVGRLGRVLGPRGLMPNPKTGTVTMDVAKAVSDIKGGRIEFRVDKDGNLSFIIGKLSFAEKDLVENFRSVADEIRRLKPATVKGRYIERVTMASTMNPGVPMDVTPLA